MNTTHDTFPEITQTVPLINKIVQMPRVAKATSGSSVLTPAIYAVVIVQVIVMSPVVLLKIETTSPAAKVELGISIEPLAPTSMNLPTSPVANS